MRSAHRLHWSQLHQQPLAFRQLSCRRLSTSKNGGAATQQERKNIVVLPGLGNSSSDYYGMQSNLEELGYSVEICQVSRADWLRNAAGLGDRNYWKGTLNPRPTVDWYLDRVDQALESIKQSTDGAPVTLVAHSAGGWLGRVYMKDFGTHGIDSFVTLGSPHMPPPKDKPGVFDQTRGILFFCEEEIPGCYHSDVKYITVAGKYRKGCGLQKTGSLGEKFLGVVYQHVCGEADVWGDGVVPNISSHLDGAINLELDDVYHSPFRSADNVSSDNSEDKQRVWYGSKGIAEKWLAYLDASINRTTAVTK